MVTWLKIKEGENRGGRKRAALHWFSPSFKRELGNNCQQQNRERTCRKLFSSSELKQKHEGKCHYGKRLIFGDSQSQQTFLGKRKNIREVPVCGADGREKNKLQQQSCFLKMFFKN